jgi:hypothetical protein
VRCLVAAAPEHGARGAGHGARWALRTVVLVSGDAGVRSYIGRHHLQHVELRRHLEKAARQRRLCMQRSHIAVNVFVAVDMRDMVQRGARLGREIRFNSAQQQGGFGNAYVSFPTEGGGCSVVGLYMMHGGQSLLCIASALLNIEHSFLQLACCAQ